MSVGACLRSIRLEMDSVRFGCVCECLPCSPKKASVSLTRSDERGGAIKTEEVLGELWAWVYYLNLVDLQKRKTPIPLHE